MKFSKFSKFLSLLAAASMMNANIISATNKSESDQKETTKVETNINSSEEETHEKNSIPEWVAPTVIFVIAAVGIAIEETKGPKIFQRAYDNWMSNKKINSIVDFLVGTSEENLPETLELTDLEIKNLCTSFCDKVSKTLSQEAKKKLSDKIGTFIASTTFLDQEKLLDQKTIEEKRKALKFLIFLCTKENNIDDIIIELQKSKENLKKYEKSKLKIKVNLGKIPYLDPKNDLSAIQKALEILQK